MSTLHLRPSHPTLWWYAAAAVLTGAVLTLIILTVRPFASEDASPAVDHHKAGDTSFETYKLTPYTCFAKRAGSNIELQSCGVHPAP